MIKIKNIAFGSKEHDQEIELRTRILREPLGLSYSQQDLLDEADDIHLGAFDDDRLVGCLLLRRREQTPLKMRQVAVDTSVQGKGVGRQLALASEDIAKQMGFRSIHLHAREAAVPFYLKLGYEIYDQPFTEVGLPHRKMKKNLGDTAS